MRIYAYTQMHIGDKPKPGFPGQWVAPILMRFSRGRSADKRKQKTMKIVNKTGRALTIFNTDPTKDPAAKSVTIHADGPAIRWEGPRSPGQTVDIDGVAIAVSRTPSPSPTELGTCELPPPAEGTTYIVSYPVEVYAFLVGRTDFVRMGPAVFSGGIQTGAIGFARS